jgi:prepilin signal peptidase PulO-like enzyme (type II secretory pathway)
MLLLIDIFSINRSRGYENPGLDIILIELCSTGGFPLEEAREHCFQIQSVISVVILISFQCYCGECSHYLAVILPFLAFYSFSSYILYLVYYKSYRSTFLGRKCGLNFFPG